MSLIGNATHSTSSMMHKDADPEMQEQVLSWMEEVIGEKISREEPVWKTLKDGVIICKMVNKVMPGSIKRIATKGQAFQLMENHTAIQKKMKEYGVPAEEIYQTPDLFEGRNVKAAIMSLFSFGRIATNKGWNGPSLGPKMSDEQKRHFTEEQIRQGRDATIGLQAGSNQGASQAGVSMGKQRMIVD